LLWLVENVQNVIGDGGEEPCLHRVVLLRPEQIIRASGESSMWSMTLNLPHAASKWVDNCE
jgi:hypothetical protein